MVQINWLKEARDDLWEIYEYISRNSVRYAQLQVSKLHENCQILKKHIRAGKVVEEIGKEDIREIIVGRYRVIYRIKSDNAADILMVHHSPRDLRRRIKER